MELYLIFLGYFLRPPVRSFTPWSAFRRLLRFSRRISIESSSFSNQKGLSFLPSRDSDFNLLPAFFFSSGREGFFSEMDFFSPLNFFFDFAPLLFSTSLPFSVSCPSAFSPAGGLARSSSFPAIQRMVFIDMVFQAHGCLPAWMKEIWNAALLQVPLRSSPHCTSNLLRVFLPTRSELPPVPGRFFFF